MCNFLFCSLQVTLVFFICANANPIIIHSAVQKNQEQQENLQRYGTVRNKGDFYTYLKEFYIFYSKFNY